MIFSQPGIYVVIKSLKSMLCKLSEGNRERMKRREKGRSLFLIFCVCLIIIQVVICTKYAGKREYLFCDEVFSYGLANSEDFPFIDPRANDNPVGNWVDHSFFTDYMECDKSVPFSFDAAFYNQACDVHPPLYYCLLHILSFLFQKNAYSVKTGILLNIIFLVLADILLFYIARFFFQSKSKALLTTFFWGFSAAAISNTMLVRMYMLQTFEILLLAAFHCWILEHKKKMTVPYWITMAIIVAIGGLTHYYFYFFMATLGACVCLYLLCNKKIAQMFAYGTSLVAGFAVAIIIFPATLQHMTGYRGEEVTNNVHSFSKDKMTAYTGWINNSLFAGMFKVIVRLFVAVLLWRVINFLFIKIQCKIEKNQSNLVIRWKFDKVNETHFVAESKITSKGWLLFFFIVADLVFLFVAIEGSALVNHRYIYPAYPILAILFVYILLNFFLKKCRKYKMILAYICCFLLCVGSIRVNGIDWMYPDYANSRGAAHNLSGQDLVLIYPENCWVNVYSGMNLLVNADECTYLSDTNISQLPELLNKRNTQNDFSIIFPKDPGYSQEQLDDMMNQIAQETGNSSYEKVYDFCFIFSVTSS